MTLAVISLLGVPGATVSERATSDDLTTRSGADGIISEVRATRSETCRSARVAAYYYRLKTWRFQELRDGELAKRSPIVAGKFLPMGALRRTGVGRLERELRSAPTGAGSTSARSGTTRLHLGTVRGRRPCARCRRRTPAPNWWLLSCSSSEGGHGRWVPNSQGSGVGGWMQMYPSTFWRMWSSARRDVHSPRLPGSIIRGELVQPARAGACERAGGSRTGGGTSGMVPDAERLHPLDGPIR